VNFIAGTTGLGWLRFTLWDVLGETIWVTVYVGLGVAFATQIEAVADILGNAVGLLAALAVAAAMLVWIRGALRAQKEKTRNAAQNAG
jgi:membrane protein DedA with SNARE-associated domain